MPDHDPEVTPEQDARLRRLLTQARHTEPTPADVVSRLDRVLVQLASEERHTASTYALADLAARRRRRARAVLLAAAAVVVVGVGVDQLVQTSSLDPATSSDAGAEAGPDPAAERSLSDSSAAAESAPESETDPLAPGASSEDSLTYGGYAPTEVAPAPSPPVRLTQRGFAAQADRFRDRRGVRSTERSTVPSQALSSSATFVCDTGGYGPGRLLPALYDGVPAVLAYRAVVGATQTVDLLRCGSGEVLRSIVLPVAD